MTRRSQRRAPCPVSIRRIVQDDIPAILRIEEASFESPWREEEFLRRLRQRNTRGYCAEARPGILGFLIYEVYNARLHVLNIAVAPSWQGRGIGRQLVCMLTGTFDPERYRPIQIEVRETNLAAQLFFRACGFRAVSVLRNSYDESSEDAYVFQCLAPAAEVHARV